MDEFIDERDGETYRTIKIGGLLWFAENLRYLGVEHYFPDRNSDNIQKYGCLYTWENAQLACPEGWRMPTETDFNNLLSYVDKHKSKSSTKFLSLIAKSTAWKCHNNRGVDEFGFGALPAGSSDSSNYDYFGYYSGFWSSTEYDGSYAYHMYLDINLANVNYFYLKTRGFSVRCVKEA